MMRRIASILLILILLATEHASIPVNVAETEDHQPTIVELDTLIREIELGIPPEGPLSDREFLMPEGVSIDDVKNLWRCAAPFVSHGADDNDIRNAFTSLMETVKLPDAVRIGNESFPIRYDKAYVERNGFGQVLIHIPIDAPLFRMLPAWFHVYSRAIGGKQRLVYNVTETRWYRVRRRIEGLYNITYLDLETGETHSVLSSLSLGVYPEFGIAGGSAQPSFPPYLLKYFPGYANLTSIPPGTLIDFERSTPSFLVAVPGHYEDVDVLIPEHEEKFRVLFPAYDPVWLTGWLVETSISSSNVETGDILEVSYVATPIDIDPEEQPLNATLTLLCPEGLEPLDDPQRVLDNAQTHGVFKLKAVAPGTYLLTLKLDGNAFFPGWPPPDELAYTVNVVGPASPKVEVSLEGGTPFFKHVNITVRLENKGAGEAINIVLEFFGDVEPLSISVGSIPAWETWTKMVTLRLKSEVASIRARATFFDSSGNKYVSEGFAMVVSPAYVVPEHFEEYTLRVPEHFEKRRVFVPGYEGYTHVKIYHPYTAFEIPGSFTISFQGIILEAEGVKVYTSFLPIADEGFELRVIPKELTLNIYGDVLVGPLIPVQGLQTTVPVKYMVVSVEPAFEETMVREDEAKSMFNSTGCGELTAPEGYEVVLASKRVVRKQVWVDSETYRRLEQEGFGRIRDGCYWYEDGNREEWPSSDAVCEATPLEREFYANSITLVYHPLQETPLETSLVRGLWLRNYATQDIEYTVTVEPVTLPPGKPESATLRAEKASCEELSIILFTNTTFWVRLRKGERLVAELFMPRLLSLPLPFPLQWWRGFTLGLINRSERIMVNIMMLSTVAMVPRELMPVIAVALGALKAYQVYNQRGEVFNATTALGNLTAMGLIYREMAEGYRLQGKHGFAAVCDELSQTFLDNAKEVAIDLGLRLVMDVTLEDFKVALGWRKASEFQQGYAAGKIVGAMVEAVSYAATYATIYHELSTATDMLTAAGKAGQLSATTVLKRFGQGLYAWITPAIWDLAETGMKAGAWLKGRLTLPDISKLILADRFSKDFGETVGKAFQSLPDGGEPEDIAKKVSDIVDRVTADNDVPESVGLRILDILSRISGEYVGEKDWGEKAYQTAETMVEAWKRVSELEAWKKGGELGRLLVDWLESLEGKKLGEALDALQKFGSLGDEELNNIGGALAKVGFSENGLKLFDTYFKTIVLEQHGKNIANALVEAVSKNSEVLEAWSNAIEKGLKILVDVSTRGEGDLNIEGRIGTGRGQILPGYYWIQVISEDSGNEVNEGLRNIGPPEGAIGLLHFEGVKGGDKYILILESVTVENFLDRVKVEYTDVADKLRKGTVGDWLKDVYGLSGASFVRDGDSIYLMIDGERIARVDAVLAGSGSRIYLEFRIAEPDGREHIFHIGWRDGEATIDVILGKHHCPVMEFAQKVVRDSGGDVVARLLYIKYLETTEAGYREANTNFLVSREEFGWGSSKWSFSNIFTTGEGIINIKTDSAWLEGPLKDIFGEEVLRKLESVGVRVALVYQHEGKTALKFAKPSDLSVRDLPEGSNAIGFLVLRMDKELPMTIGGVEIDFSESLVEKTQITYSRDLTITKGSYSRTLQADVIFTSPEGILIMKTGFGNLEILRKFWYDSDMKSVVYGDFVRMGDVEAAINDVIRFEILANVPCLGDMALIQYTKDGETYNMVGGLTKELPETFTGIRSRATSHAWLIANYLKYELDKGYTEGWRVDDVEVNYKDMRFDVVATRLDERKAIMEFKTIFEPNDADDLIKQAGNYLNVCTEEDSGFAELIYVFQVDQNGEIPKKDVKTLYNTLNEFLTTGKLRLRDSTVILDMSPEEASRILRILTYTGGYVP